MNNFGICSHKTRKGSRIVKSDMASEKTLRIEQTKKGQQEMQEKTARRTKMVISLTKGKGITDGPKEPAPQKDGIDPFIVPNLNNHGEQEKLKENQSGRSEHVNMQQRCSLLDKMLKKIEEVNDLGSVDPKELSLVPNVIIPPKFKMPKFKKYDGTKCPRIIWPRIVTRWRGTPITKIC